MRDELTILSTGPLRGEIIRAAAEKGVLIEVCAFIETEFALSEQTRVMVEKTFDENANVIFTSSNAVKAVGSLHTGPSPRWNIYCTDQVTRDLVKDLFGESCIRATAPSALDLAKKITRDIDHGEVLFFCGDQRREELPAHLKQNGITVREIGVYKTLSRSHRIEKEYPGILFYSPSAVQSFFDSNDIPGNTTLFAIGHTTAEAVRERTPNRIVTASIPQKEVLVKEAINFLNHTDANND